jgi:hypothetical protein
MNHFVSFHFNHLNILNSEMYLLSFHATSATTTSQTGRSPPYWSRIAPLGLETNSCIKELRFETCHLIVSVIVKLCLQYQELRFIRIAYCGFAFLSRLLIIFSITSPVEQEVQWTWPLGWRAPRWWFNKW